MFKKNILNDDELLANAFDTPNNDVEQYEKMERFESAIS